MCLFKGRVSHFRPYHQTQGQSFFRSGSGGVWRGNHIDQLDFSGQTFFSPKEVFFPVREAMFNVDGDTLNDVVFAEKPALVFLRSCDIHALEVMDLHFLAGPQPDIYYQRRRNQMRIVLIECPEPFEHCHCLSFSIDKTLNYHAFMRRDKEHDEWIVCDETLAPYFNFKLAEVQGPCAVPYNKETTPIPEGMDKAVFDHEMWKEYSRRCIACGRCNTSCPTCTCFSVWDVKTEKGSERQRIWSACHVKKFSILAGNHDFRTKNGERMRYKVLHKIQDFSRPRPASRCARAAGAVMSCVLNTSACFAVSAS